METINLICKLSKVSISNDDCLLIFSYVKYPSIEMQFSTKEILSIYNMPLTDFKKLKYDNNFKLVEYFSEKRFEILLFEDDLGNQICNIKNPNIFANDLFSYIKNF